MDAFAKRIDPQHWTDVYAEGYFDYHNNPAFDDCYMYMALQIHQLRWRADMQKHLRVVEMGCHVANVLRFLKEENHYTGIDVAEGAIEASQTLWKDRKNTEFLKYDLEKIFDSWLLNADVVLSGNVLVYLTASCRFAFVDDFVKRTGAEYFIFYEVDKVNSSAFKSEYTLLASQRFILDLPNEHTAKGCRRIEVYKT